MLEIFIEMPEDDYETIIIKREIKKLCRNGWFKFGNNGSIVLFKDISLDEGVIELDYLDINDLEVDEWEEN